MRDVQLTVAGVDGCRGGWLVASASDDGPPMVEVVATFAEIVARRYTVIGVDMPIGLAADGLRAADSDARAQLGARRSSLFPTPAHAVLGATDYADALRRSRLATGKGLSIQAFNLLPKTREVRDVADERCFEVHPETSFAVMGGGPMAFPKRTAAGVAERRHALERLGLWPATGETRGAAADDVLDALVALWTSRRIATKSARRFGDPEARDPDGFRLTIHA